MGSPAGSLEKNLPVSAGDIRDGGSIPGQGDPLEEKMATHSRIPAWRIPWTEEPTPQGRKKSDMTELLTLLLLQWDSWAVQGECQLFAF